jgi:hypothetical protein
MDSCRRRKVMWFVYGDYVLDRILGLDRAQRIAIFFTESEIQPQQNAVALSLDLRHRLPLDYTNMAPRVVSTFQRYGISETGMYYDILESSQIPDVPLPLRMELLTSELTVSDISNLWITQIKYPEIKVHPKLMARLAADIDYLEFISEEFPEVAHILYLDRLRIDGTTPSRSHLR